MKYFLRDVAQLYYDQYREQVSQFRFVFPNRRAGLFFQKHLAGLVKKPLFSPSITTDRELIFNLSGFRQADRIEMLFLLYESLKQRTDHLETLDEFLHWGDILLNDFDEVDKFLIDPQQIFLNLKELKEIDQLSEYLSPEQIEAIRRFWTHFLPIRGKETKEHFIATWQVLLEVYTDLQTALRKTSCAYDGMAFRQVAESLKNGELNLVNEPKTIFVGLNMMTPAQEVILKAFKNQVNADFYWDYFSPLIRLGENKASMFVARNELLFPSKMELPKREESIPEIQLIGVTSSVGQAKQAGVILSELYPQNKENISAEKLLNTAIVLPNEQLLLPTLYSIPENIAPINVTMGYNLSQTPIAALVQYVSDLQKNMIRKEKEFLFHHEYVLKILGHSYITQLYEKESKELTDRIKSNNRLFVSTEELSCSPLFAHLFRSIELAVDCADYLITIMELLQRGVTPQETNDSQENEQQPYITLSTIEKEFMYQYYITIKRLRDLLSDRGTPLGVNGFFQLLKRLTGTIAVPFKGEPLSGLQIMGTLETRSLDFENLLILSVNEGTFPAQKSHTSFIPYSLRMAFDLPTSETEDALTAYNFYRLIYRAKQVFLFYDTRSEGLQGGEISRFVHQLRYLYQYPIHERNIHFQVRSDLTKPFQIQKTAEVMNDLSRYYKDGDKNLSASAINQYIACPLRFYLCHVQGIEQEEELSMQMDGGDFGSVFHKTMELLYEPFIGRQVDAEVLHLMRKNDKLLTKTIEEAFAQCYFKGKSHSLKGHYFLIGEIIRRYVKQLLIRDAKQTPFTYLASEKRIEQLLSISKNRQIRLKIIIDRVEKNRLGKTLIVDYKTGKDKLEPIHEISELFISDKNKKHNAVAMQVLMYCLVYEMETEIQDSVPHIVSLRKLFDENETRNLKWNTKQNIESYTELASEFQQSFTSCIEEIFDPNTPFTQAVNPESCKYCPVKTICKK